MSQSTQQELVPRIIEILDQSYGFMQVDTLITNLAKDKEMILDTLDWMEKQHWIVLESRMGIFARLNRQEPRWQWFLRVHCFSIGILLLFGLAFLAYYMHQGTAILICIGLMACWHFVIKFVNLYSEVLSPKIRLTRI